MKPLTRLKEHLGESGISEASISLLDDAMDKVLLNEVLVRAIMAGAGITDCGESGEHSNLEIELDVELKDFLDKEVEKLRKEIR